MSGICDRNKSYRKSRSSLCKLSIFTDLKMNRAAVILTIEEQITLLQSYRQHSLEFKRALVALLLEPGVSVARIAFKRGVNVNQVFSWHSLDQQGRLGVPALVRDACRIGVTQPPLPTARTCLSWAMCACRSKASPTWSCWRKCSIWY